jgi:hypothetical protein
VRQQIAPLPRARAQQEQQAAGEAAQEVFHLPGVLELAQELLLPRGQPAQESFQQVMALRERELGFHQGWL